MKVFSALALISSAVAGVQAGSWSATGVKASIMFDVSFPSDQVGYVSAGPELLRTEDGKTFNPCTTPQTTIMTLACAGQSATSAIASGLAIGVAATSYSTDGTNFKLDDDTKPQIDACQDAGVADGIDNGFFATGTFGMTDGVIVSSNGGQHFDRFGWGYNASSSAGARYTSIPTADTWYISGGMWPEAPSDSIAAQPNVYSKSKYVHVKHGGEPTVVLDTTRSTSNDNSSWIGVVQKTTDGGKTFTNVFEDTSGFYMNQIACTDANTCHVTAEGDGGAFIFRTTDGGATWTQTLTAPVGESLTTIKFVDANNGFAGGAMLVSQVDIEGHMYTTTDAGVTWTLSSDIVKGAYFQDLAMTNSGANGWGAAITVAQIGELYRFA